ncbi:putative mfs transporter protein [Botrytis fragariae]|uniref:Putative mfs transporter protein n=1 Tax=Botrytis fragariae TaxID=1964551 RepID=A0A8H6ATI5_9HELO|nr:putative mfs transporter protein [Botrytis fragariae]KAF5873175.1 putative mfs transporter protein [Botrytis fragariae]
MSEKLGLPQKPAGSCIAPISTEATNSEIKSEPQQESHPTTREVVEELSYPNKVKFALIFGTLLLSTFVIGFVGANATDSNCVATIIPVITDEFHSANDIGWYGTAYLIPSCALIVFYGKLYTFYSTKKIYICSFIIYEIGSIMCATAPSSLVFIIGRAIAGTGSAGLVSGSKISIISLIVPLHRRPLYQGIIGGVENIAITAGPLIAGAVTAASSWRVCFWISIPIGVVGAIVLIIFGRMPDTERENLSTVERLKMLPTSSILLFLPLVILLVLALSWGGSKYSWNNFRIILMLALMTALLVTFISLQLYKQDKAMFPPRIVRQRSVLSGIVFIFCVSASLYVTAYYLPIYFQAVRGASTFDSSVRTLPLVVGLIFGSFGGGYFTTVVGYYTSSMILTSILTAIGSGFLSRLRVNTQAPEWIVFQALFGFGCGIGFQQPYVAVQTTIPRIDIPIAITTVAFSQRMGNIVALAIAQNLFTNRLIANLTKTVPQVNANLVLSNGVTTLRSTVEPKYLDAVLAGYSLTIDQIFLLAVALCSLSVVGSLGMEWKSVKKGRTGNT